MREGSWKVRLFPKLVAATTSDMQELNRQKALYDEAVPIFAAYKKAEFPAGKTHELQQIEDSLARTLAEFPKALQQSMAMLSEGPDKQLADAASALQRDQEWRTDPKKTPYTLDEARIAAIRQGIAKLAEQVPAADPKLAELNQKLAGLVKENDERRRARAERTFMIPDRFQGEGGDAVKAKAVELVNKDFPDAQPLRTTVISQDWKEEDKVEFTDTTETAVRRRVTRSVTAQVAAKRGDQVLLYTVYVAKDRRSDGTWGPLYGNLHQTADPMLERNVPANAP